MTKKKPESTTGDDPQPESTTEPKSSPTSDEAAYDYVIDPMIGLPKIELPDDEELEAIEEELRIGRAAPVDDDDLDDDGPTIAYRAAASDPVFGFLIAMAISFGLMPLLPDGAAMRYTLAWGTLAVFGVLAWLFGNGERIGQEVPENIVWGVILGAVVATPLYLFGGQTLTTTTTVLFADLSPGMLLAYVVFVMPLGETLFFRGVLQQNRSIFFVSVMSTAWSALLFFPFIRDLTQFWAVVIFIGTTLAIVNVVYSWVRERNGLAAAWVCQIVASLILIFLPFMSQ